MMMSSYSSAKEEKGDYDSVKTSGDRNDSVKKSPTDERYLASEENSSSDDDDSLSDSDISLSLKNMSQQQQPRRLAYRRNRPPQQRQSRGGLQSSLKLKDLHSSSSTVTTFQSSLSSLSSSICSRSSSLTSSIKMHQGQGQQGGQGLLRSSSTSPLQLPIGCLRPSDVDGCDEAELRAREERCQEIMRLSQQAKEAEIARAKAANIKPLTWAAPTFEYGPTAADVDSANKLGKRKEHPDQGTSSSSSSSTRRNPSHHDLMYRPVFLPLRQPSQEEIDMFVEFANKYLPSSKRRRTEETEVIEEEEEKGEKTM
jgi:hypothetical protein